jgi:hypothetical protein
VCEDLRAGYRGYLDQVRPCGLAREGEEDEVAKVANTLIPAISDIASFAGRDGSNSSARSVVVVAVSMASP